MSRLAPRIHRLPKRTDYILIPAPLDLSLPEVTEKSHLPAIIVTPSSPISPRDFSIAFIASPPKPSLRERLFSKKPFGTPSLRARSIMLVLLVIFILVCHLVTHRLAIRRPFLDLTMQTNEPQLGDSTGPQAWLNFRTNLAKAIHNDRSALASSPGASVANVPE